MNTIKEYQARLTEISTACEKATGEELTKLVDEATNIKTMIDEANTRKELAEMAKFVDTKGGEKNFDPANTEKAMKLLNGGTVTYSAKEFVTKAALTTGDNIVLPNHTTTTVNDGFNAVSTLADLVTTEYIEGGETYSVPFIKSVTEGKITKEGVAAEDTMPTFDYAKISRNKITSYGSVTNEVLKLPMANYEAKVLSEMNLAVRRKVVEQIINGTGTEQFAGIFSNASALKAINATKDIKITAIDDQTLDKICIAYGGDEDVMQGYLILSKPTLLEFANVRVDGRKYYDIDSKARTINGVPYVLCSKVKAFSAAVKNDFVMAYGEPINFSVTYFSPIEITKSEHYMFADGQVAYKAECFAGGNVIKQDGFVRVKKDVV